jgi:CDP-6-deoxy-D-xylo-4-hexulose-3-dehydrase
MVFVKPINLIYKDLNRPSNSGDLSIMFWKLQENVISDSDINSLVTFIKHTSRFTQYKKVKEFEQRFAKWQNCKYCVFVNSGSSANLLLVNAVMNFKKWVAGDEVIVPAITWPTTITPILQLGLKPVFVDSNLSDLSFDYEQFEKKITARTRGIFVSHLLGFPADVKRLNDIIEGRNITLLEDCCESLGATVDGIKVGNFGLGGTFSTYWGHHMTTVEGGIVCTNDSDLYKLLVLKRSHGLAREMPEMYHADLRAKYSDIDFNFLFLTDGFNFRNTEFNAVLGLSQMDKLDDFIKIRNRNYSIFVEMCEKYPKALITLKTKGLSSFVFPFLFNKYDDKILFQKSIGKAGIELRPLIGGNLLRQPFLNSYYNLNDFPNSDFLHSNAFYIGNNQFVNHERLKTLDKIMSDFFGGA